MFFCNLNGLFIRTPRKVSMKILPSNTKLQLIIILLKYLYNYRQLHLLYPSRFERKSASFFFVIYWRLPFTQPTDRHTHTSLIGCGVFGNPKMQFLFKQRCMALPSMWALKHSEPRQVDSTVRGHAHVFIVLKARQASKSINKRLL